MLKNIKPYITFVATAVLVGGVSALLTQKNMSIYLDVSTPPLSPPAFVFAVVWSILFVLMGISASMVYTQKGVALKQKGSALYVYALSLLANFLWSIIFFNLRAFLLAFIWLLGLLFLIVLTIVKYYKINTLAAYLQIPYALWVSFAGYLNFAIWYLNQ